MEQSVLVGFGTAVLVAVVVVLWDLVKTHRRRRARASYYKRMSTSQPAQLPDERTGRAIGPEQLEHIRIEAENAARMAFMFPQQKIVNPYADGTRESVLWTASYNLRYLDLSETRERDDHASLSGARES